MTVYSTIYQVSLAFFSQVVARHIWHLASLAPIKNVINSVDKRFMVPCH